MTAWTVQCRYAVYHARTETVEAETFEAALARAVERANASGRWTALDHHCGPTFVAAAAEGADADPFGPDALPVPRRLTEAGEAPPPSPPLVIVGLRPDGRPSVCVSGGRVRVRIEDGA